MKSTKQKTNEELVTIKDFNGLYQKNKPFLYKAAREYSTIGNEHREDLVQAGRIGLFQAMERFNPDNKSTFLSYARYWIKKEMLEYINNNLRTVRLPVNVIYDKDRNKLPVENMLSLDQQVSDDDNSNQLYSTIAYDEPETKDDDDVQMQFKDCLKKCLPKLNDNHQQIIKMLYYEEKTVSEIAAELGKTKQAISEQHQLALTKIRSHFNINDL